MGRNPQFYRWSFPGSPVKVHLDLDVAESMAAEIRSGAAGSEASGLLLGRTSGAVTEIVEFRALNCDRAGVRPAIEELPPLEPGALFPVGYYRTQQNQDLRLNADDLELAEACFQDPHCVFLAIHVEGSEPTNACFFFRDDRGMQGDFALLDFPFDAQLMMAAALCAAEREAREAEAARLEAVPVPALRAAGSRRRVAPKAAAGLIIAASLIVTGTLTRARLFPDAPSPAKLDLDRVSAAEPAGELRNQKQNRQLKLSWNREAAAIKSASSAMLTIQDGNSRHTLPIGTATLRAGAVSYIPATDVVAATLSVCGSSPPESAIAVASRPAVPNTPTLTPVARASRSAPVAKPVPVPTHDSAPVVQVVRTPRTVEVQVTINLAGEVVKARVVPQDGIDEAFAETALTAALGWRFPAAETNGTMVREKTLHFREPYSR